MDSHEQANVVAYREQFCRIRFDWYLTRMESYEGPEMFEILPELAVRESNFVPIFHDESTFNANEDQRYCRLEKDK